MLGTYAAPEAAAAAEAAAESCGELLRWDRPSTGSTDLGCTINISKAVLCVDITFGNSFAVQLWLVSTIEFWRFRLRAVGSAARFKQADEWTQLRWIICGGILLMIFQNVATYSYICTYVLNAQPCIVWEGKMFIEYIIHTQDIHKSLLLLTVGLVWDVRMVGTTVRLDVFH